MFARIVSLAVFGAMVLSSPGNCQTTNAAVARATLVATAPAATAPSLRPALAAFDATDAERRIDGYLPYALRRAGIPGAVVVIVKDDRIVFSKGYGVSDVKSGAPVDPAKTLFRPGSISKTFTWTAIMQLVERGKLDLDADVNRYIDFKIPPFNGKPVTLRQILTHSGGFEEVAKNIIVSKPESYLPFEKVLKLWVPTRVADPGQYPAYSNYASTLAGYIVQRVSGEPYNDYIANHILKPLGMNNSTFVQPLPKAMAGQMSKGYFSTERPKPAYELVSMAPAGALAAPGEDMARFMMAHLNSGTYNGVQILKPETADLMHRTALQAVPPLNGMALGFMKLDQNGNRAFGHGGDTEAFHSLMTLFPDEKLGLFISLNGAGKEGASGPVRFELTNLIVDRYLPRESEAVSTVDAKTAAAHAALLAASNYVSSRTTSTSLLALGNLLGQATFSANPDGTISLSALKDVSGAPVRYREVSPFVWHEVGGPNRLAAVVKDGKVVMWAVEPFSSIVVFRPVEPAKSAKLLIPMAGAALLVLVLSVIAWPITALVRRRYRAPFPLAGRRATGYRLTRIAALLVVIGLAGIGYVLSSISGGLEGIEALANQNGLILAIEAVLAIGLIGGLVAAAYNLFATLTGGAGWFGKLWSLLLLFAFGVLLWVAFAFKLINFSTNF